MSIIVSNSNIFNAKPLAIKVQTGKIPNELTNLKQWVCWKWHFKEGEQKWSKVPINPIDRSFASSTNPNTWNAYDYALKIYQNENYGLDGIGFVLTAPYVGIDLDKCRERETQRINDWAMGIALKLDTYGEVSPSGTGLKFIMRGRIDHAHKNKQIEIYQKGRFFTITGEQVYTHALHERQEAIDTLVAKYFPVIEKPKPERKTTLEMGDAELLTRAKTAKNGAKFEKLWTGDTSDYPSKSEADMALCGLLHFWTGGNAEQIDRLFRLSGLYNAKWDRLGVSMIAKVSCDEVYQGSIDLPANYEAQLEQVIKPVEPPKTNINFITADLLERSAMDNKTVFLIDRILPAGEVTMPHALPWAGKSTILAYMMARMGTGLDFFGFKTMRCPIIYINADQGSDALIWSRLLPHFGNEDEKRKFRECFFMPETKSLKLPLPRNYLQECVDQLRPILKVQSKHGLIVVDTIRPAFISGMQAGAENDATAMMSFLPEIKRVAGETKWGVVAVHHNNRTRDDYAGSAAIAGQVDSFWSIKRDMQSSTATVDFATRHGYQGSIAVCRNEYGQLERVESDEDLALTGFVNFFPKEEEKAVTYERACELTGMAKGTVKNKCGVACRRDDRPKLVRTGSFHEPRFYRV